MKILGGGLKEDHGMALQDLFYLLLLCKTMSDTALPATGLNRVCGNIMANFTTKEN